MGRTQHTKSLSSDLNASQPESPCISFQHAFGISGPLADDTIFLVQSQDVDGQTYDQIIFPVGKHVVAYDPNENTTFFFPRTFHHPTPQHHPKQKHVQIESITALATHHNKYLAVCDTIASCTFSSSGSFTSCSSSSSTETTTNTSVKNDFNEKKSMETTNLHPSQTQQIQPQTQTQSQLSIYKISNRQLLRTVWIPPNKGDRILSASFCGLDGKLIATISKKSLCVWCWEKESLVFCHDFHSSASSSTIQSSPQPLPTNPKKNSPRKTVDMISRMYNITKVRSPFFAGDSIKSNSKHKHKRNHHHSLDDFPIMTTSGQGHFRLWSPTSALSTINRKERDGTMTITAMPKQWNQSAIMQSQKQEKKYDFVDHVWLEDGPDHTGKQSHAKQKHLEKQHQQQQFQEELENVQTYRLAAICSSLTKMHSKTETTNPDYCLQVFRVTQQQHHFHVEILQIIPFDYTKFSVTIHSIARYGELGCIMVGDHGYVAVYQDKIEGAEVMLYKGKIFHCGINEVFTSVCTSSEEDNVILFSSSRRLIKLSTTSQNAVDETKEATKISTKSNLHEGGFHEGCVLDIHAAIQRPLVVTCGIDQTVRIWNIEKLTCDIVQEFYHEEPTTVSIHPSGLLVIVGFKDRVRMYYVLIGKMILFKEMQCKDCRKVLFSTGGQYFAVASGSFISVYLTYSNGRGSALQLVCTFTGHIGQVNILLWCHGDTFLYSAGKDGNVYGWDVPNNSLVNDTNVLRRSTGYVGVVVDLTCEKDKTCKIVVCSVDGSLMEISWNENHKDIQNLRKIYPESCIQEKITAICLSLDHHLFFVGTSTGNLRVYKWPLEDQIFSLQEFPIHQNTFQTRSSNRLSMKTTNAVISLHTTQDRLISTGEDGSIFILSLSDQEKIFNLKSSYYTNVVLVSANDYEEGLEEKTELERKIEDLKRENEFSLHSKDIMWKGEMKELIENTDKMVLAERQRFQEVQRKHEQTIDQHVKDLEDRDKQHCNEIQVLKGQHNQKVMIEIERSDELEQTLKNLQERHAQLSREQHESYEKAIREGEQKLEKVETNLSSIISRLKDEAKQSEAVFKEILNQQEEEYEMELMKLAADTKSRLSEEHNMTQQVRGVVQVIQSRQEQLDKKNQELKAKTDGHEQEYLREKKKCQEIEEARIQNKEILLQYKDQLLQKDNEIETLKSSNHALESYRFVLEDQLSEIKHERDPMAKQILDLQSELKSQQQELKNEREKLAHIKLQIQKKDWTIHAKEREISAMKGKLRKSERELSGIKKELTELVGDNQLCNNYQGLDKAVKRVYQKFVKDRHIPIEK